MRGQGPNGIGTQEDFSRWKPKDKQDWMTMTELARYVERDASWLRRMDRQGVTIHGFEWSLVYGCQLKEGHV